MEAPKPWTKPPSWPVPIETERLVLRPLSHEDVQAVFEAVEANRPSLVPWMPWPNTENLSIGQTHFTIERFLRNLESDVPENVHTSIFDRVTGQYLGGTGLHTFVPGSHQAETGYWVIEDRRGSGICTEAVVGLTEVALRTQAAGGMGLRRLEIACSADNEPSARVALKAGYQLEATLRQHRWVDTIGWSDTLIFAALADSWSAP